MNHPTMQQNPLKQYFRGIKLYIKLPSGTSYYSPGQVDFTNEGEIGILPMTGRDELILKNPDALLNGEALIEVLTSCVPAVKNPRVLLTNDIDALITAIRYATFGDSLESEMICPSCGTANTFKLDLQYALDNMSELDADYVITLDSGLSVFVKPYAFPELLKGLHTQFEQTKISRSLENQAITDVQRSNIFGKAFKDLATIKFELMSASVVKIVDEANNVNVTDKKFINEFLQNIDKVSADKIGVLIAEINQIGIKRSFTAKCSKCEHEWQNDIDFNPVNFS